MERVDLGEDVDVVSTTMLLVSMMKVYNEERVAINKMCLEHNSKVFLLSHCFDSSADLRKVQS